MEPSEETLELVRRQAREMIERLAAAARDPHAGKPVGVALREFHDLLGHPNRRVPTGTIPDRERNLRLRLIREELGELLDAMDAEDPVEIADALADLTYVVVGTAVTYGIPFDEVFAEVHRSNMTKVDPTLGPLFDEHGKGLKPPSWSPPELYGILVAHGWEGNEAERIAEERDAERPPLLDDVEDVT